MSEEIERIVVGPDTISVLGTRTRTRNICQCGHQKAYHDEMWGCRKLILHPGITTYYECECRCFVDLVHQEPRRWPWWLPAVIFALNLLTFAAGVLIGRLK